jgi:hypothetical protein
MVMMAMRHKAHIAIKNDGKKIKCCAFLKKAGLQDSHDIL